MYDKNYMMEVQKLFFLLTDKVTNNISEELII